MKHKAIFKTLVSVMSIQLIALLAACSETTTTTGNTSQRSETASPGSDAVATQTAQVQTDAAVSAAPDNTASLRTATSKDLLSKVTDAATVDVSASAKATVAPAPTASPAELEALVSADITKRIMDAWAAHPKSMSQDDAKELASLLCSFLKNATAKDSAAAADTLNKLNKKILAIAAKRPPIFGLYDNSNFLGRIMNGANSFIDVAAELYAAVLSLSPQQALGAGESAVRNIMNLFS